MKFLNMKSSRKQVIVDFLMVFQQLVCLLLLCCLRMADAAFRRIFLFVVLAKLRFHSFTHYWPFVFCGYIWEIPRKPESVSVKLFSLELLAFSFHFQQNFPNHLAESLQRNRCSEITGIVILQYTLLILVTFFIVVGSCTQRIKSLTKSEKSQKI